MLNEGQYSHMQSHWDKMEEIIIRGGGNRLRWVYNPYVDDQFDTSDAKVCCDGRTCFVPEGRQVCLTPDESIIIYQRMYHDSQVESGTGSVLADQFSICNDDNTNNRFMKL